MKVIDVYEVRGDYGNVGDGRTLGIFESESKALQNAIGCGSLDCGGDAEVRPRKAVEVEPDKYFLVDKDGPFELNEMEWSAARDNHPLDHCLVLETIPKKIATIKVIREHLHLGLKESKAITDEVPYTFFLTSEGAQRFAAALVEVGCTVSWKNAKDESL